MSGMHEGEPRVKVTGESVYISWDGKRYRASYTVARRTGQLTDNHDPQINRDDITIVAGILRGAGEKSLADKVKRFHRNLT